ncbi:hypothetical protein AVEN_17919-1 [Araneus ventricosus]|uniref:Uncharacterized protein n=1 Tax=Araneus ventricosus TaxID=182803 RepID=A0A4Y2FYI8_ARAVE|nr:hypothetical protein AVEN_17919-1 [Araneus ventricosus]
MLQTHDASICWPFKQRISFSQEGKLVDPGLNDCKGSGIKSRKTSLSSAKGQVTMPRKDFYHRKGKGIMPRQDSLYPLQDRGLCEKGLLFIHCKQLTMPRRISLSIAKNGTMPRRSFFVSIRKDS